MKKIILILFAAVCSSSTFAQVKTNIEKNDSSKFICTPETPPSYPGGNEAFMTLVKENLKYPVDCEKNGVEGRVILSFNIAEDGTRSDTINVLKLMKFTRPETDPLSQMLVEEAKRVVRLTPKKWIPANINGKNKSTNYVIPINFKLQNSSYPDQKTDSIIQHALDITKENEGMIDDPHGLYRLLLFTYDNGKKPEVPPFEQYKYVGKNGAFSFAYNEGKNYALVNIRDEKNPLHFTGNKPNALNDKLSRVYNSGPTGFTYTWYSQGQYNKKLFPDTTFVNELYSSKELNSSKVAKIFNILKMQFEGDAKKNQLLGVWRKSAEIPNGESEYLIIDQDNAVDFFVMSNKDFRATASLIPITFGKGAFFLNGVKYEYKKYGKDSIITTRKRDDGSDIIVVYTRSELPAGFKELLAE